MRNALILAACCRIEARARGSWSFVAVDIERECYWVGKLNTDASLRPQLLR